MKVAVNTRLLLANKLEGIGWFTFESLKRIVRSHPDVDFIFIFDRPYDQQFIFEKNVKPVVVRPPARHPILFRIWFNWSVQRVLKKYKPDVFLSPDGYLSLTTNIPSLAVIHDLNFEHFPEDLKPIHTKYYQKYFPLFAKKAARIATVSNYSKNDIVERYLIDPAKIDVVYNGVSDLFFPITAEQKVIVKRKYTQNVDYFIFIGSLHPRKNISRLLKAFDGFKKETDSDVKFIIVGERYWWNSSMEAEFERLEFKEDVEFVGRKSQKELNQLLGASIALCFVPYFEGFGIPILEAFNCGVPVITSNVTSMPEVAGDAALLVNPFKVEEITVSMRKICSDNQLRSSLIEKGFDQVKKFSWDKTAEKLWESIQKTASSGKT